MHFLQINTIFLFRGGRHQCPKAGGLAGICLQGISPVIKEEENGEQPQGDGLESAALMRSLT